MTTTAQMWCLHRLDTSAELTSSQLADAVRSQLPVQELSLLRIISRIIPPRRLCTSHISLGAFTFSLSPTFTAFHGCKPAQADHRGRRPAHFTQNFDLRFLFKATQYFPRNVFMFLIHLSLTHKLDGFFPGNLENLGPRNRT